MEHHTAYTIIRAATPIATMTRPRISKASLISSLAIFRIFLWRCHDPRFLVCSGLNASGGCAGPPRYPHVESEGSWYGAGLRKLKRDEFLVRERAFWVSTRKREMRKEVKRKGVRMI